MFKLVMENVSGCEQTRDSETHVDLDDSAPVERRVMLCLEDFDNHLSFQPFPTSPSLHSVLSNPTLTETHLEIPVANGHNHPNFLHTFLNTMPFHAVEWLFFLCKLLSVATTWHPFKRGEKFEVTFDSPKLYCERSFRDCKHRLLMVDPPFPACETFSCRSLFKFFGRTYLRFSLFVDRNINNASVLDMFRTFASNFDLECTQVYPFFIVYTPYPMFKLDSLLPFFEVANCSAGFLLERETLPHVQTIVLCDLTPSQLRRAFTFRDKPWLEMEPKCFLLKRDLLPNWTGTCPVVGEVRPSVHEVFYEQLFYFLVSCICTPRFFVFDPAAQEISKIIPVKDHKNKLFYEQVLHTKKPLPAVKYHKMENYREGVIFTYVRSLSPFYDNFVKFTQFLFGYKLAEDLSEAYVNLFVQYPFYGEEVPPASLPSPVDSDEEYYEDVI